MTPASSIPSTRALPHAVAQQQTLCRFRECYRQDHDLFSRQERARLRFMRWLFQTGRLVG